MRIVLCSLVVLLLVEAAFCDIFSNTAFGDLVGFQQADILGGDIGTVWGASPLDCARACDMNDQCMAWVFSTCGDPANTCWLKSGQAGNRVLPAPCRESGYKSGVQMDYPGGDMPNQPTNIGPNGYASACAKICRATPGCVAWAFDTCGGSNCWLKNQVNGKGTPNSCRRSGIEGRIGGDLIGGDIASQGLAGVATTTDCANLCMNTANCNGWAYTLGGPNCETANMCWLKHLGGNPGVGANPCRASGVVGGQSGNGGGGGNNNGNTNGGQSSGNGGGGQQSRYHNVANMKGNNFFSFFNWDTENDPTHGYVNYVDSGTAFNRGYASSNNDNVYIGGDNSNVAGGRGRDSIRLTSKSQWHYGLFVMDASHMPTGCGTWPAWWLVGGNWPNGGEIDIIEGVNNINYDQTTLHTSPGCTLSGDTSQYSGHLASTDCNAFANGNAGCGIQPRQGNAYGAGFNGAQGGVYAVEWTAQFIKAWFFPRGQIPGDVYNNPLPQNWGQPFAYFPLGGQCPENKFGPLNMVFDNTYCGDWAGAVFGQQCPGKGACVDFVRNNPHEFGESYWRVNQVLVYQM